MERKFVNVGDHIIYTDPRRQQHSALVVEVHDSGVEQRRDSLPALNLLYVVDDETRMDQYGRQIERESSVVHHTMNSAGGNCYHLSDE
jgi:hypothetical protein